MLQQIWQDESASVLSAEMILLATALVIGMIVGAKSFRDSAVTEWADYAQAIADLDQSYNIPDHVVSGDTIYGSHFIDVQDFCDTATIEGGVPTYGGMWVNGFLPYTDSYGLELWNPPTFGVPASFEN